ncbi:MAG TPA: lamin tail domain-containing protein [Herpetosiphonaceae bacterium]
MFIDWMYLFELLTLGLLLFLSNRFSMVIGAVLSFSISQTILLPYIGGLFRKLLQSPFNLNVVVKLSNWLISSSGLLMGLQIYYLIWGEPNSTAEYWLILFFALGAVLEIGNEIVTFDAKYFYVDNLYPSMKNFYLFKNLTDQFSHLWNRSLARQVARATFVDQAIPHFFRLLINIGAVYFCLGRLNLLEIQGTPPSLLQSILLSFSLIDITGEFDTPFTGYVWDVIRLLSSFLTFFWLVMFITICASSVDEAADNMLSAIDEENKILNQKMYAPPPTKNLQNVHVKILEALVDPPSKQDAGNESITLYNAGEHEHFLTNWSLQDDDKRVALIPTFSLAPKESRTIKIPTNSIRLKNDSGVIVLLNENDVEIDRVTYTRSDIGEEGTVKFYKKLDNTRQL